MWPSPVVGMSELRSVAAVVVEVVWFVQSRRPAAVAVNFLV